MNFKHICPDCFHGSFCGGKCGDCGYEEEERSEKCLPLFSVLSERYIVGRVLGLGGSGITYKCCDTSNNHVCAVREYAPISISVRLSDEVTIMPMHGQEDSFKIGLKSFMKEAELRRRLSAVKELVKFIDCFSENNTSYYTMEYVKGTSLKEFMKGNKLPYGFCCRVMAQTGRMLEEMHTQCKMIHGNIEPGNILITNTGDIRLIGLGDAEKCTGKKSKNPPSVWNHDFAPPEHYSGKGVWGPWSDVYEFACTFYRLAAGKAIPPALDRMMGEIYKPLYQMNPQCTEEVSDMIDLAMKFNPKERLRSIKPLVEVLEREFASVIHY